jgi:cystathionine beta-lyase/cystathionine gamma-synthase
VPESHPARMGHPHRSVSTPSAPPIFQTTAFDIADLDVLQAMYSGEAFGDIYTRDSNPNHNALGESIALLEHAEAGAVFASGMGALGSAFLSLLSAGDHVLLADSLYGKTVQLVDRLQKAMSLSVTWFSVRNPLEIPSLLTDRTRLVLVETVSNPLLDVADVPTIASLLPASVPLIVDATFTTPILSRPCEQGASVVIHSGSKYLNGHGDVMLGLAAGKASCIRSMIETASIFGQNANPFESWLCQRGMRTLPLRMAQICRTTRELAAFFSGQSGISRVYYPLLEQHPTFATATRLYPEGTGGIVSIELSRKGKESVNRFFRAAASLPFSPTLADARTTLSHPASTSHRFLSEAARREKGISDELIRISVGLESADQLTSEFSKAIVAADVP